MKITRSIRLIILFLIQFPKRIIIEYPFIVGLCIRFVLMIVLPRWMDNPSNNSSIPPYTDIDYHVYIDAATYIQQGQSPYQRYTYRYTPYLAYILSFAKNKSWWRHANYFGRGIFCVSDAICGLLIQYQRNQQRQKTQGIPSSWVDAFFWLYNPLAIHICTRGSAESFIVLLPVLTSLTLALHVSTWRRRSYVDTNRVLQNTTTTSIQQEKQTRKKRIWLFSILTGIMHGLAIHTKLYPMIYTLSFMVYFSKQEISLWYHYDATAVAAPCRTKITTQSRKKTIHFISHFYYYFKRRVFDLLLQPSSLLFFVSCICTFIFLTWISIQQYGIIAFQEGFIYHFTRMDHRHNYSMFWYWIYLAKASYHRNNYSHDDDLVSDSYNHIQQSPSFYLSQVINTALVLPQIVLIVMTSFTVAPYDLSLALFIQTFLFVLQNKVMTAQYFTWYLCLLPLCTFNIQWKDEDDMIPFRNVWICIGLFLLSVVNWLSMAFQVEMMGKSYHLSLWIASVLFYVAQVVIGTILLRSCYRFHVEEQKDTTTYENTMNRKKEKERHMSLWRFVEGRIF